MGNARIGALHVELGLRSAAFARGMTQSERRVQRFSQRIDRMGQRMQRAGARMTVGVTAPLALLGRTALQAAIESREAEAQISAALISMGNASGRTREQLLSSAEALQHISTFDKDDILQNVTAQMLTFGNVSGEVFDRATQAVVDYSARTGREMLSASLMFGRALNDPILGLTAMTRVGIQFSESQQQMIRDMVASGDIIGAQTVLLEELERQYGGSAQAARDAAPGSDTVDAWRQFKELLGEVILRVLPSLTDKLTALLGAFNQLSPGMQSTIVISLGVAAALGPVLLLIGSIYRGIAVLLPLFVRFGTLVGVLTVRVPLLATAFVGLRGAMAFLLGPWGLLLAGIAAGTYYVYTKVNEATQASEEYRQREEQLAAAQETVVEVTDRLANATGEAAAAAREAARDAQRLALERLRQAQAALTAAQAERELALAELQRRSAEAAATRVGANPMGGGMGTELSGPIAGAAQRRLDQATADLQSAIRAGQQSAEQLNALTDALRAPVNVPGNSSAPASASTGSGRSGGSGQNAQDLAARREALALQQQLDVAVAEGNRERERETRLIIDLARRIEDYRDAGLSEAAAATAAARDMQDLQRARTVASEREIALREEDIDLQIEQLRNNNAQIAEIERQRDLRELINFYRSQELKLAEATRRAEQDIAEIEAARAQNSQVRQADQRREFELELARARGDSDGSIRAREADLRRRDRVRELQSDFRLTEAEAIAQAVREGAELSEATLQGSFRKTFRDGLRAAMNNDLGGFLRNWFEDAAFRGMSIGLDRLADMAAGLFSGLFRQSKSGGGGFFGTIGKILEVGGSVAGGLGKGGGGLKKGLAAGGSIRIKGASGIDKNMLSINGVEAARVGRDETIEVRPNDSSAPAMGGVTIINNIDAKGAEIGVDQKIANALVAAAPGIARKAKADTIKALGRRAM